MRQNIFPRGGAARRFIGKTHVIEHDVAVHEPDGNGVFGVLFGRDGEHLAEADKARKPVLDLLEQIDEGADGR